MSVKSIFAGVALPLCVLLAGCGVTVSPKPASTSSASPSPTESPAAEARPVIPLDGDCERLLSTAEVQAATGLNVQLATPDLLPFATQVAVLNGLQCEWLLDRSRVVAVTLFPSSVLDGTEPRSEDCWEGTDQIGGGCFFDRIVGEHWFAGFVETVPAPAVSPQTAIETITTLVQTRLDEPPPPAWQPAGAWRMDIDCREFAGLDLNALGLDTFEPSIGETGGNAGPGPWFAYDRSGYRACDLVTGDRMNGASIQVQPGGGWALPDPSAGQQVEVMGAEAAVMTEPWPGAKMLAVSDGVNLAIIGAGEIADAAILAGIAEQVLALPLG